MLYRLFLGGQFKQLERGTNLFCFEFEAPVEGFKGGVQRVA